MPSRFQMRVIYFYKDSREWYAQTRILDLIKPYD